MSTSEPRIAEVMGRRPLVFPATLSIRRAARRLARRRFVGAPVVDSGRRYTGTVTTVRLIAALVEAAFHDHPPDPISAHLDPEIEPLEETDPLLVAVRRFAVPAPVPLLLPVLREGHVVGVVTHHDVVRALARLLEDPGGSEAATLYFSSWDEPDAPFDARRS